MRIQGSVNNSSYCCLLSSFLHNSFKNPDADCFKIDSKVYTYKEVELLAKNLASNIKQYIQKGKPRIAIYADKSEAAYVSILASFILGCSYVPLNPKFPEERNKKILDKADVSIVIAESNQLLKIKEYKLKHNQKFINYHEHIFSAMSEKLEVINAINTSDTIAYILFTSGSTGEPKGVPITHGNVTEFISYCSKRYDIKNNDRLTQFFDLTFDLSVFDIFMAWSNGASFYPLTGAKMIAPIKFLLENKITIWFSVPSAADRMIKANLLKEKCLPTLRLSLFCGEALKIRTATLWSKAAPRAVVENLYGPTELTIACAVHTYKMLEEQDMHSIVPLGKVFPHMQYQIVDENAKEVLKNEIGELLINGSQMFKGYWRDPDITRKAFHNDERKKGELFYKTGDLVREDENGVLIYIGRKDQQIKINGYRIELGDIENALRSIGLDEAIVVLKREEINEDKLVAYISENIPVDTCKENLNGMLPAYMIPSRFIVIKDFPLNINGKIDRKLLSSIKYDHP